jgi:hypothetical protein
MLKRLSIFIGCALIRLGIKSFFSFFYESLKYFKYFSFNLVTDYLGRLSLFELFNRSSLLKGTVTPNNTFIYNCSEPLTYGKKGFSVYQGSFNNDLKKIDLLLPVMFPLETKNLYLNLEGRYRETKTIVKIGRGVYTEVEVFQFLN